MLFVVGWVFFLLEDGEFLIFKKIMMDLDGVCFLG